jgi:hypothetical protein
VICGRGGVQAAVAFALLAAAAAARAGPDLPAVPLLPETPDRTPRVALLSAVANDPLAGRIDAELRAVGVDVSRAAIAPATGIEEQVRTALAGGARAVVVADGHRTDVWIAQDGSDRVGLRQELEVDETSGLQAVLALRTVEFLRISLGLASEPAVAPLERSPVVARVVAPPPPPEPARWLAADVSSGVLASLGGLGVVAVAGVSLRAQLAGVVGAEICAFFPLTDSVLAESGGQVRTSVWLAGGGVLFAPRLGRRVSVDAATGALAVFVRATGTPTPAGPGVTDEQTGVALYARAALRFRVMQRLVLRLDVLGGGAVRRPVISVAGRDVASWGTPFAAGLGGAELWF